VIDYESLSPTHNGSYVWPIYYGGPLDGDRHHSVASADIKGSIRMRGGSYSLQGFRRGKAPAGLEQFAMEFAVYEWVYDK
jgi:hypothetical protein